jgi:hypothetical protein
MSLFHLQKPEITLVGSTHTATTATSPAALPLCHLLWHHENSLGGPYGLIARVRRIRPYLSWTLQG